MAESTNTCDKTKESTSGTRTMAATMEDDATVGDFEKAINAAGFGAFNLLVLFVALLATIASVFETTTMSYIFPVAECDLKLTLFNKGALNAATYAGMIMSAIIWGYLADTKGRKKILVYGYLADGICVLGSAVSQNFEMLMIFKFFGGFIVNGPGAVLFTYLTELHNAKQRPRVLLIVGVLTSGASLVLPTLAWAIFPRDWDFTLFDSLNIYSWHIFLAVCGLPSLLSGSLLMLLPESPKFLMSQGRHAEALKAFQTIYYHNTKRPKDTYPIKTLIDEIPMRATSTKEVIYTIENLTETTKVDSATEAKTRTFAASISAGMQQIKPMFNKPLLGRSIHCYTIQFCMLLGLNTIRLWLPQLFASIAEYEHLIVDKDESTNLCTILEYSINKTAKAVANYESDRSCTDSKNVSMDMYMNNIIVALSSLFGYLFAGAIVRAVGNRRILTLGLLISGGFGLGLYWSSSGMTTLVISSIFITVSSIACSSLLGLVVALFPTQLRSLIVAITMMFGRLGALSGNILFPVFIEIGCMPPFLMVSSVMICAAALSLLLPNPSKEGFS